MNNSFVEYSSLCLCMFWYSMLQFLSSIVIIHKLKSSAQIIVIKDIYGTSVKDNQNTI